MKKNPLVLGLSLLLISSVSLAETKPKYGPNAHPLTTQNQHLKSHAAPDYWALSPFYQAQGTGSSCSLASATMVMNGLRKSATLTSDDELATEKSMLEKSKSEFWKKATGDKGTGVMLDQLPEVLQAALAGFGMKDYAVEVRRFDGDAKKSLTELRALLAQNEKSDRDFIIINFVQGVATGDADVGHIAPIGAFDAAKDQVLIMDPDRTWYEPYWTPTATLMEAMNKKDSGAGKARGLVYIHPKK